MKKMSNGNPSTSKEPIRGRMIKPDDGAELQTKSSDKQIKKQPEPIWIPPDGGWGWLCVFSCFFTFFLIIGMSRTFGIIYDDVFDTFPNVSHVQITMIPAMVVTLTVGFAVVAGALTAAFTCRKVAFVGGLMSASGVALSSLAISPYFMQCMFVIAGIGASLACTPGILIVSKYFRKRRAQAVGLALAGTAIGGFILPIFVERLANEYGFRGALLIEGGLMYNVCACALLYREPYPRVRRYKQKNLTITHPKIDENAPSMLKEGAAMSHVPQSESDSVEVMLKPADQKPLLTTTPSKTPSKTAPTTEVKTIDASAEGRYALPPSQEPNWCFRWVDKYLYVDLYLLYNPVFLVMLASTTFMTVGYPQSLTYFPPYAGSLGYAKESQALLLSISAVGDLMGRLISGWVFDKGYITKQVGFILCTALLSLSLIGTALYANYIWLSVCVFFYGYFAGSSFLLIPVLLSEQFGISKLSSSFGIVRSFQGITSLLGPPIAGHIKDETGSFRYSLLILGSLTILSTLFMLLMTPVKKRYRKKHNINIVSQV